MTSNNNDTKKSPVHFHFLKEKEVLIQAMQEIQKIIDGLPDNRSNLILETALYRVNRLKDNLDKVKIMLTKQGLQDDQ